MDPGQVNLQRLKAVPNLVDEDPSIVTPKNSSFVDMSWKDFEKQLDESRQNNKKKHPVSTSTEEDITHTYPEKGSIEDFSLCNWDAETGYQNIKSPSS